MTAVLDDLQLQTLLTSPRLPFIARKIDRVLVDEGKRREAFYEQITEGDKAEFINGEIIFHSPVRLRHDSASGNLYRLLSSFVLLHDLGHVGYEKLLISLTRNDYEPDICYFNKTKAEGFVPDQMRFPAPDFVVEVISTSTEDNDRGVKFDDYAAHGIAEYWIIDPAAETLEQYRLREDEDSYELVIKAMNGQVLSIAVPGFDIPIRALFDQEENRAALQAILSA